MLCLVFYQLCWFLGASQSDVAFLGSENVDWSARVISFARKKTRTVSMIHFGDEVEAVLRTLPATGAFFPKLRKLNSGHRATEFTRVCRRAGVHGVTLHCYRYIQFSLATMWPLALQVNESVLVSTP